MFSWSVQRGSINTARASFCTWKKTRSSASGGEWGFLLEDRLVTDGSMPSFHSSPLHVTDKNEGDELCAYSCTRWLLWVTGHPMAVASWWLFVGVEAFSDSIYTVQYHRTDQLGDSSESGTAEVRDQSCGMNVSRVTITHTKTDCAEPSFSGRSGTLASRGHFSAPGGPVCRLS